MKTEFSIIENNWYSVTDDLNIDDFFTFETIKTNKQITYYNDVLAFDIETSSFKEDNTELNYIDDEVYSYIRGIRIKVPKTLYSDIPDLNEMRRILFGRIYFSNSEGISIDSLYHDLNSRYPWYFPEDIINAADELEQIVKIFLENSPEEIEDDNKRGIMYVWQLAINGKVIIGRTWDEFISLTEQISRAFELAEDRRMIIYVHNLSFEFAFIANLFTWDKVFAISTRKPIYAVTSTGIEFRCSFILSNLSLENVGESLHTYKVKKQVGSLNYERVRHAETPLTDREYHYIINDVLVVSAFIKEAMEDEGNDITKIPLTATGYCRNYCRKNCLVGKNRRTKKEQFNKYHEMIRHLSISGIDEYFQMVRAFQGGFTHTGILHSGKCRYNVTSLDLCSAYPAALCLFREFPMSKGTVVEVHTVEDLKKYCLLYCCIFDVKLINIRPKYLNENYISCSKCGKKGLSYDKWVEKYHVVTNNGRLVAADEIETTITNIDYEIIEKTYDFDIQIGTFRIYKRGYLPKEIIMSILHLYKNKTELKGVPGKEEFYTKNKQLLNACYGMMVTSIIMPVHTFDNEYGWTVDHKDAEKAIKSYSTSKKRFNFYAWGIFCTAIVRRIIFNAILAFGDDYLYTDTDSIKAVNYEKHAQYINEYNRDIEQKIQDVAKYYDIPVDYFMPKTIKGVKKVLGIFEDETSKGKWKIFKALRAKAYMVLDCNNELSMTVSGVNKKAAVPYMIAKYGKYKAFQMFSDNLEIPPEYTGKLTHFYIDEPHDGLITDYRGKTIPYHSDSGIYLEKTPYNFSLQGEYLRYIKERQGIII